MLQFKVDNKQIYSKIDCNITTAGHMIQTVAYICILNTSCLNCNRWYGSGHLISIGGGEELVEKQCASDILFNKNILFPTSDLSKIKNGV